MQSTIGNLRKGGFSVCVKGLLQLTQSTEEPERKRGSQQAATTETFQRNKDASLPALRHLISTCLNRIVLVWVSSYEPQFSLPTYTELGLETLVQKRSWLSKVHLVFILVCLEPSLLMREPYMEDYVRHSNHRQSPHMSHQNYQMQFTCYKYPPNFMTGLQLSQQSHTTRDPKWFKSIRCTSHKSKRDSYLLRVENKIVQSKAPPKSHFI